MFFFVRVVECNALHSRELLAMNSRELLVMLIRGFINQQCTVHPNNKNNTTVPCTAVHPGACPRDGSKRVLTCFWVLGREAVAPRTPSSRTGVV